MAYNGQDGEVFSPSAPRSKTLSLGMNNLGSSPLRFRPLQKASDYPVASIDGKAPAPPSNPPVCEQLELIQDPAAHEHYKPAMVDTHAEFYPPDDDVSLSSQYTDFQKQIIAEQRSQPAPLLQQQYKDKVLSLGLQRNDYSETPRSDALISERTLKREKYIEYQKKLMADETVAITPTRQKFERKNLDVGGGGAFLAIGSSKDDETIKREKKESQRVYQAQLMNDINFKPVEVERKSLDRRSWSPPTRGSDLMANIGTGAGPGTLSEVDRRHQAQLILDANREDVMEKIAAGSPEERRARRQGAHSKVEEIVKFEQAPYHGIGAASEHSSSAAKKKAMQQQYLNALLHDNGPPPQGKISPVKGAPPGQQYVDVSGWTGLNIGGHSTDESKTLNGSATEKVSKQAAYKRMLDNQMSQREQLIQQDYSRYGKY